MPGAKLPDFAIIADAHFHDIDSDYDCPGTIISGKRLNLRSWADTRRSSRVFNESKAALESALTDIGQRGIRHVILLGDYTDDGQIEATERLVKLLQHYQQQYAMAFYALPGNHDVHGPVGKHQSTRFATTPGKTVLVSSSADVAATESETSVLTHKMYCEGTPAGLLPMAEFALFRQPQYLHWETPFGQCDSTESRRYDAISADGQVIHQLVDASYLVEPVEGLWLLMIDANIFEPRNGQWKITQKKAFLNSADAGWNSVLRVKPYLIDWINDVCSRAALAGKRLFTFSHYPTIDPFNDQGADEKKLFVHSEILKRTPEAIVASALSTAGVQLHFGGHLHINGSVQQNINGCKITDIAVPSLVAFPACYKIVQPTPDGCRINTMPLSTMPLDSELIKHYCEETSAMGTDKEPALCASSYGEFLYQRVYSRVLHHYLPKEWPENLAGEVIHTNVADLVYLLLTQKTKTQQINFGPMPDAERLATQTALVLKLNSQQSQFDISLNEMGKCSMTTLISDWYCLKHAGEQAIPYIGSGNLKLYIFVANTFGDNSSMDANTDFAFFSIFLSTMNSYLQRAMNCQAESDSTTLTLSM